MNWKRSLMVLTLALTIVAGGTWISGSIANDARAWSSATFDGQEHELAFDLWTSGGGSAESKEIAGAIIDRLHNADFPVTGHALVDLQFSNSETRYLQEKGVFQCHLRFRALTVND